MEDVSNATKFDDICDIRSKSEKRGAVEKKIRLSILQRYFDGSLKGVAKSIANMQVMVFDK